MSNIFLILLNCYLLLTFHIELQHASIFSQYKTHNYYYCLIMYQFTWRIIFALNKITFTFVWSLLQWEGWYLLIWKQINPVWIQRGIDKPGSVIINTDTWWRKTGDAMTLFILSFILFVIILNQGKLFDGVLNSSAAFVYNYYKINTDISIIFF